MTTVGIGALAFVIWTLPGAAVSYSSPGSLETGGDPELCRLAEEQVRRYPRARVVDLYKFAHQAAFGAGHAVPDARHARDWLMREIENLPPADPETPSPLLLEPLLPDGSLVRVHLRPWVDAGRDPEALLSAFVRTANTYKGSYSVLVTYWECFRDLARDGMLTSDVDQLDLFMRAREGEGWPPHHHSTAFESEYEPAYRVVWSEFLSGSQEPE